MKEYKCEECGKTWASAVEPFECPSCHSAKIAIVGGNGPSVKRYWWIVAVAIVLAVLLLLLLPNKGSTRVSTKADEKYHTLSVSLSGESAAKYTLVLRQDGVLMQRYRLSEDDVEHTFTDLCGEYVLEVVWEGGGAAPDVNNYDREFDFGGWCSSDGGGEGGEVPGSGSMMPEIIQIVSSPGRISKKGETYTIKVILDDHFAGEAEYSIDNAQWQTSNTFPRLVPGEYEIFVRNSRQDAYRDSKPVKLLEEPKITLTVDEANDLLSRVSDGDDEAKKKLKQCFGNSILVVGVENINTLQDLLRDCCVLGNRYEIISISGNKITVRNK